MSKYIIVGGVAGGASTAARLRRLDEDAQILMLDKGPDVSFSNCGLPYYLGGEIKEIDNLILMNPKKFKDQYNIDVLVNSEVIRVDSKNKKVIVKNTLNGEEFEESYDKLILSPGAQAFVPPFEGLDKVDYFTVKTVVDIKKIDSYIMNNNPKDVTVIGGGFIGVEVAENFKKKGFNVTLIEGSDQIIAPLDKEMSHFLHKEMSDNGVEVILNDLVEGFEKGKVLLKSGKEIKTDFVIMSIGVKPDTKFLEDSNIDIERGYIKVNSNYQTTNKDIYAIGDAILIDNALTNQKQPLALASPANKQGRLVADVINGKAINNKGYIGTSVIQVFNYIAASTGINEKEAIKLGIDYMVAYAAPTDKVSIMPKANLMPIKIVFEKGSKKLLGGQVVSYGNADKRVDVLATALKAGMTVEDLKDLELSYAPTVGTGKDVVNKIGYIASNLEEGLYEQVTFKEVYDLLQTGAQIIDVREEHEYKNGHLKGVKNIPLTTLRQRVGEIDKDKELFVHCQSGQRSYNATLLLKSLGFNVKNVAGGFYFINMYEEMERKYDKKRKDIVER